VCGVESDVGDNDAGWQPEQKRPAPGGVEDDAGVVPYTSTAAAVVIIVSGASHVLITR
jgi:hypothetical protein